MATTQTATVTVTSGELYSARSLPYREQIKVLKNARDNGGLTLNISLRGATATDVDFELRYQADKLKASEEKAKQGTKAQQQAEYLMNADPMGIYRDMTQENAVRLAPGTYETWRNVQERLGNPTLPRHIARQKYGYTSDI